MQALEEPARSDRRDPNAVPTDDTAVAARARDEPGAVSDQAARLIDQTWPRAQPSNWSFPVGSRT
tara:strand:- start:29 stop:223 length:195 start_codon:yes stop_codon:yes gene_type:complete